MSPSCISASVALFFSGNSDMESDASSSNDPEAPPPEEEVTIHRSRLHAHHGYIHAMELGTILGQQEGQEEEFLFTGAGDGVIRIWRILPTGLKLYKSLEAADGNVYTLAIHNGLLIAGIQGGEVRIWDLEMLHAIRTLIAHEDDILNVVAIDDSFFTASADGIIKVRKRERRKGGEMEKASMDPSYKQKGNVHYLTNLTLSFLYSAGIIISSAFKILLGIRALSFP